ncbi:hypothetical protein IWX81_000314 [Salinibacterium sp. CAN_S4]|uniref:hypothetical protein n=1 Tax=Salinibacterium sp. CAN_S4 TaxID=2787727 RepID=UPI0018F02E56
MSEPIIVTAAERSPIRIRRGVGLGIASFVLSMIAGSWVIILWAVSIGATQPGSGRAIAIVFFTVCAIIGFVFLALTAVTATFSFTRNLRLGRVWAAIASVVGVVALVGAVVLAVSVATA